VGGSEGGSQTNAQLMHRQAVKQKRGDKINTTESMTKLFRVSVSVPAFWDKGKTGGKGQGGATVEWRTVQRIHSELSLTTINIIYRELEWSLLLLATSLALGKGPPNCPTENLQKALCLTDPEPQL